MIWLWKSKIEVFLKKYEREREEFYFIFCSDPTTIVGIFVALKMKIFFFRDQPHNEEHFINFWKIGSVPEFNSTRCQGIFKILVFFGSFEHFLGTLRISS